jgi:hypothetical protein
MSVLFETLQCLLHVAQKIAENPAVFGTEAEHFSGFCQAEEAVASTFGCLGPQD